MTFLSILNGRSKMAYISTSFFFNNKEYWSYKWESVPSPHPHLHPGPLQEAKTSPVCLRLSVISIIISVVLFECYIKQKAMFKKHFE